MLQVHPRWYAILRERVLRWSAPLRAIRYLHQEQPLATVGEFFTISHDGAWLAMDGPRYTCMLVPIYGIREWRAPLEAHTGFVRDAAFSPIDSTQLVTGSADHSVVLWTVFNGVTNVSHRVVGTHQHAVRAVAWSPDGSHILSASLDATVCVWDVATLACLYTIDLTYNSAESMAFSRSGNLLAVGGLGDNLHLLDSRAKYEPVGRVDQIYPPNKILQMNHVAVHPTQPLVAFAGEIAPDVTLFDVSVPSAPRVVGVLRGHTSRITSVQFSADGTLLATSSCDRTVRLWDVASRKVLRVLRGHTSLVHTVRFHPKHDRLLISQDYFGAVRWWGADDSQHWLPQLNQLCTHD
jgi:WD40 repeat protein